MIRRGQGGRKQEWRETEKVGCYFDKRFFLSCSFIRSGLIVLRSMSIVRNSVLNSFSFSRSPSTAFCDSFNLLPTRFAFSITLKREVKRKMMKREVCE